MDAAAETRDSIAARVKRVLVETLDLSTDPGRLPEDTSLYSPLIQMDSLNLLHVSVALESEFGGRITEDDVLEADLEDVSSVIRLVETKLRQCI